MRPNRFTIRPCCAAEKRLATWSGLSALRDVVKMFPAAPQDYPGNPRPPAGFPEVKIGKVQPEPATVYNPPETGYALFFDDNDKLVIIEDAHSPRRPRPEDRASALPRAQGHRPRRTGDRTPGPNRAVHRDDGPVQRADAKSNQGCVRLHLSDQRFAKHSPRRHPLPFPAEVLPLGDRRAGPASGTDAGDPVPRMVGQQAAMAFSEQVLAQRATVVAGAHAASPLQLGHHQFDKLNEAAGLVDRHQVDAVDSGFVDPALEFVGDVRGLADDERIRLASFISSLASASVSGARSGCAAENHRAADLIPSDGKRSSTSSSRNCARSTPSIRRTARTRPRDWRTSVGGAP